MHPLPWLFQYFFGVERRQVYSVGLVRSWNWFEQSDPAQSAYSFINSSGLFTDADYSDKPMPSGQMRLQSFSQK